VTGLALACALFWAPAAPATVHSGIATDPVGDAESGQAGEDIAYVRATYDDVTGAVEARVGFAGPTSDADNASVAARFRSSGASCGDTVNAAEFSIETGPSGGLATFFQRDLPGPVNLAAEHAEANRETGARYANPALAAEGYSCVFVRVFSQPQGTVDQLQPSLVLVPGQPLPPAPAAPAKAALRLSLEKRQRLPRLRITATTDPGTRVRVRTSIVAGKRTYRVPAVRRTASATGRAKLTVRIRGKALRAARAALRRGSRVTARLEARAGVGADATTRKVRIRLRG
jgi:hypothetical protein